MALERIENLLQLPRQSFEKIELFKKKIILILQQKLIMSLIMILEKINIFELI